jgi:uncharacterized membrane protein
MVPWSIWIGAQIRSLPDGRKWTAIALRSLILLALIGALAGMEMVKKSDKLAVFFVLDQSSSIPEAVRQESAQWVRNLADTYMTDKDEAGIIVAGEEASIELSVGPNLDFDQVQSYVQGEQTDLAAALRLAMAAFPQGHMKRIVLYTDGNETMGSVLEEVKVAQASDVAVDVVPLQTVTGNEVRIRQVAAPSQVSADEPFKLQVVVNSDQDTQGTLRIYQRRREGKRLLQEAEVNLQQGDNAFVLPQELRQSGFYEYEATIETESDTILANNEGRSFTIIQGEPTVLYIQGSGETGAFLGDALQQEGVRVEQTDLGNVPVSLAQFQNYDAVVLSDVSSVDLSSDQMSSIEAMVRDLGIGLVMVGGPESFGAGGYLDTPIERALPVDMDLKQRKMMPRGALALILHTCEIADGNAWSREIGMAALNVLSSQDLMGALCYHYQNGDSWLYELQPVGDKSLMAEALKTTQIGDMPTVQPTLQQAYNALSTADAAVKRVIMISDGDPQAPSATLLASLAAAKIAVSTICVSPHSPNDQQMLKWVASKTGGEYYYVTNPNNLPQIFTKEAAVVKRGLLVEEPFTPEALHDSEIVRGVAGEGLPTLYGYVATTPKDSATIPLVSHEGDPILAHWRYGLGKSVAFTSDASQRWAKDWVGWEGFNPFWAQTVRWAVRDTAPSSFRVNTEVRDGMGHVTIDAVDTSGNFINFLRPEGVVTGPAPDFERQPIALMQTGPGIYEGSYPLQDRGVYMMSLTYEHEDGSRGMIPAGLALDYSREYEYTSVNRPLLEQIAATGGGSVLASTESPFTHNLVATPVVTPIWMYLVAFAVCALPLEIFVRRVVFSPRGIWAWVLKWLKKLPGLGRMITVPQLQPAAVTGNFGGTRVVAQHADYSDVAPDELRAADVADGDAMTGAAVSSSGAAPSAPQPEAPKPPEYTQQLLAAKERALKRRGRRSGDDRPGTDTRENE